MPAGLERSITLSADYAFTANPTAGDPEVDQLTAEMKDLYTRPSEGLIEISSRIAALANRIAGPDPDCWRRLRRIWDFIFDNLTFGIVQYDQIGTANPSEWVLDNGVADCQLGSALLISLCRALKDSGPACKRILTLLGRPERSLLGGNIYRRSGLGPR